ncbi:MAG: MBL fold metallo-hydrolase [Gemmatimonadetes bacterium]|nr:MBL fold metallo-hydrolase [Gemmatimonadota bacterium]
MAAPFWRLRADNPGPFTFDGTVSYILGHSDRVILDPGPNVDDHVRALVRGVAGAARVRIVLTHGHPDHAGGVDALVRALEEAGSAPSDIVGAGHPDARPLSADEAVVFDAGRLVAVPTPGHTRDHLAWWWPERGGLFTGDHVLGHGDTTWVAEYPGCVADYLASLERVRRLEPLVVHPGHGPDLDDPPEAFDRFEAHRRQRIEQVRACRRREPGIAGDALYRRVYGDRVPAGLEGAARRSLAAVAEYVDTVPE